MIPKISDKNKPLSQYLIEANDKVEGLTIFFMKCSFGFFSSNILMGFVLILYPFIKFGHFESENLYLPYNYV